MILNTNPNLGTHISINQNQNSANSNPILINLNKFKSTLIKPKSTFTILGSSVPRLYNKTHWQLTHQTCDPCPILRMISNLASCSRSDGVMIEPPLCCVCVCVCVCERERERERERESLFTMLHHCSLISCVHSSHTYQTHFYISILFFYFIFSYYSPTKTGIYK